MCGELARAHCLVEALLHVCSYRRHVVLVRQRVALNPVFRMWTAPMRGQCQGIVYGAYGGHRKPRVVVGGPLVKGNAHTQHMVSRSLALAHLQVKWVPVWGEHARCIHAVHQKHLGAR